MSSLSDIEAVLAVARYSSFRSAATALGVSRSALSHAVAAFERRLDLRLFHRTTRSVALTEAGRRFVEGVGPALEEIKACIDTVSATRPELGGTLRINTFAPAARWLLQPLFLPYLHRHPAVHLDIVTDGRFVDIVKEGFDAGIRPSAAVPLDMIALDLGHAFRFSVVAAPSYLARYGMPTHPDHLSAHRCICNRLPSGRISPWRFSIGGNVTESIYVGPMTLDDLPVILDATKAGIGLAYVPAEDVADAIGTGSLHPVLAEWMPESVPLSLYYPGRRHVPATLRAFIDVCRTRTV